MAARPTSLLESQRFLRASLDALPSHIAILDAQGLVVEVNRAWKDVAAAEGCLHGRPGVGDDYLKLCDSAAGGSCPEASAVAGGIRAVMSGEREAFQLEYLSRGPQDQRWVVLRITRFRDGGQIWVVVAQEDITERKLAEQALRESDEKFRQLADNISDVFWIRSADMRELHYVSPGFERIWGRPVSTLYENPGKWVDYIHADDRARAVAAFSAFMSGTQALDIEYRITRPDETIRWVRVRGFQARDAAGKPIRYVGIVTDVTEKRDTEHALRKSEQRMRLQATALDSAANGVLITDCHGTIQWLNPAFTRLTGYSAQEAVGRNPRMLKSGQQSESAYRQMWETISAGRVWSGEVINRRKDGGFYHEEMTITPVRDEGGAITHFIAVKQDISERKRAEASIQDLHRKLVVASREAGKADVAADVLHSVGNVLNSVNVSATLALDHVRQTKAANVSRLAGLLRQHTADLADFLTKDPVGRKIPDFLGSLAEALAEEQKTVVAELEDLRQNIEHINAIIARQENVARAADVVETFPVADMVEDALRIHVDALTGHDIEMIRDFQARPDITSDKHKVTQILIDVVANARRACDRSGRSDKQITARITSDAGRVRIAIIDNGTGIAAEDLARMFSQNSAIREDSYGFGLHRGAIAATELGGSLHVQSDGPGRGATFVLELPCQPATPLA